MMNSNHFQNSVLLRTQPQNKWLLFSNPLKVVEVYSRQSLLEALFRINDLVNSRGLYAAGFLSYEAAPAFDKALSVQHDYNFPLLWFGLYDSVRESGPCSECKRGILETEWFPELEYQEYKRCIKAIKRYIQNGDTYQVNFTLRLRSIFQSDPWLYFSTLALSNDPPFGAYINTDRYSICSFSPELFFRLDQDILLSRPMKGTAQRGCMTWDDEMRGRELMSCRKNRAENVMITDMVRNDMGRIADAGSVEVTDIFRAEKYPTVWQMVSQIRCRTSAGIPALFSSLFPPASITGAPKSSTMRIITGQEVSPRRIYTGSIGYFGPNRQSQFNVAIRTVLVDKHSKLAEYGIGGGIVWDSTDKGEWEECRVKAGSLYRINAPFSLLETILWTPEGGYHMLGAHLGRLKSSAEYFDYHVDIQEIISRLKGFSRYLIHKSWKIRLLIDRLGRAVIEKHPLECIDEPLIISSAKSPVDSSNVFLYHKTTNRELYDNALPNDRRADSVLLWNENREATESTAANLVFEMDGALYTPPVRCGLLPGIYRQFLLGSGTIRERVILLQDLKACSNIFLINSVRGFVRTRLV